MAARAITIDPSRACIECKCCLGVSKWGGMPICLDCLEGRPCKHGVEGGSLPQATRVKPMPLAHKGAVLDQSADAPPAPATYGPSKPYTVVKLSDVPGPCYGESRYDAMCRDLVELPKDRAICMTFGTSSQAKHFTATLTKKLEARGSALATSRSSDGCTRYYWIGEA